MMVSSTTTIPVILVVSMFIRMFGALACPEGQVCEEEKGQPGLYLVQKQARQVLSADSSTREAEAPTAPTPIVVGQGYCSKPGSYKPFAVNLGIEGCFTATKNDKACVNSNNPGVTNVISYGKGTRSGSCVCDTVANCVPTPTSIAYGADGFDRYSQAPTPLTAIVVGEGFCDKPGGYKPFAVNLGVEGCLTAAKNDNACVDKNLISYGKGTRSGSCVCDTVANCVPTPTSIAMGADGFDKYSEAPATGTPTTEAPTTKAPTTAVPTTEAPTTASPTPLPPVQTNSPTSVQAPATAVGDPHLVNTRGEAFSIE